MNCYFGLSQTVMLPSQCVKKCAFTNTNDMKTEIGFITDNILNKNIPKLIFEFCFIPLNFLSKQNIKLSRYCRNK